MKDLKITLYPAHTGPLRQESCTAFVIGPFKFSIGYLDNTSCDIAIHTSLLKHGRMSLISPAFHIRLNNGVIAPRMF